MRKLLVISTVLLSFGLAQNNGLVKTYYPNGALETEETTQMVFGTDFGSFGMKEKSSKTMEKILSQTQMILVKIMAFGILQKPLY